MKSVLNYGILKEARAQKHFSLGVLAYMVAEKLGKRISRQALHSYETGKIMPSVEVLKAVCAVLEVDPKDILK